MVQEEEEEGREEGVGEEGLEWRELVGCVCLCVCGSRVWIVFVLAVVRYLVVLLL